MTDTIPAPSPAPAPRPKVQYWDPVGQMVSADSFQADTEKLLEKLKAFQEHPEKLHRNRFWLWTVGFIGSGILLIILYLWMSTQPEGKNDLRIFMTLLIPFLPALIYTAYVFRIQKDLVCCLFAKAHGWVYNPNSSSEHAQKLLTSFPMIFSRPHASGQRVEDEFWGELEVDGTAFSFWKAPYSYNVTEGKHTHTYVNDAIAFRLPRTLNATLILKPDGFHLFGGEGHDDVKTESVEFNRTFAISCPGMTDQKKMDIIRALSPALQTRFLDLLKKKGPYLMQLQHDAIVLCFTKYTSPVYYTNFFKKVELDSRDSEILQKDFQDILKIAGELLRFLD